MMITNKQLSRRTMLRAAGAALALAAVRRLDCALAARTGSGFGIATWAGSASTRSSSAKVHVAGTSVNVGVAEPGGSLLAGVRGADHGRLRRARRPGAGRMPDRAGARPAATAAPGRRTDADRAHTRPG